jgi:hypothetical protein
MQARVALIALIAAAIRFTTAARVSADSSAATLQAGAVIVPPAWGDLLAFHIWRRCRMLRILVTAWAVALLLGACSKGPTRPIVDGYTLQGVVTERNGAPLSDVSVLLGREGSSEFRLFAMTGSDGTFLFKPAPASGPSTELFRFEKPGFASLEVLARTATRLEAYRYRLDVELDPQPTP